MLKTESPFNIWYTVRSVSLFLSPNFVKILLLKSWNISQNLYFYRKFTKLEVKTKIFAAKTRGKNYHPKSYVKSWIDKLSSLERVKRRLFFLESIKIYKLFHQLKVSNEKTKQNLRRKKWEYFTSAYRGKPTWQSTFWFWNIVGFTFDKSGVGCFTFVIGSFVIYNQMFYNQFCFYSFFIDNTCVLYYVHVYR